MDFVCLAAGKGTRFGALGRYLQKCMLPVALTPFLEYTVRNLRRNPACDPERDRLLVLVGHRGEQVRAYFGDAYEGLPIRYLEQGEARGTGHALATVAAALEGDAPAVVWLGDLYVPGPLFGAIARHEDANALTLAPGGLDANASVRVTVDAGRVTKAWYGRGPLADIGLWKLEPAVMAAMHEPTGDEVRALPNLQRQIEAGLSVGWLRAEEWLHLGGTEPTPEENVLAVARRVLELQGAEP
ncbi:MAG TPA: NTP transferase domain-containing protein [Trueperaceae bacterium]|nr:NTP transferase domain-containing protein [Trueperaceae bacterium]